ncbi:MAG: hypothetical protein PHP06_02365 [Clostridia bacterium]|nr:hypothetical protein [Clostridia bacterium]
MEIVAFVGPSGTGKSHRALNIAKSRGINYIIDDGLFIKDTKIIAGYSAKKESTKIGAIKRAMFVHSEHCEIVKEAIKAENPSSIMVIGTSEGMVEKIASNLDLPLPNTKIFIQEIATDSQILKARRVRKEQGKHVIPVPTFEIKKDFSGYFVDPLKIFRKKDSSNIDISEKSVVRPTYSYLGRFYINDTALDSIVRYSCGSVDGILKVISVDIRSYESGIIITVELYLQYGGNIINTLKHVQKKLVNDVEYMTGLNVLKADIVAKKLKR